MNDELNYAEMLEIPVETVTVRRKERKKREKEPDLQEQLVEEVNEKLESEDPSYAESTPIARNAPYEGRKKKVARRVIVGEFIAVCALCAAIFLTNIFLPNSAINTFVRGLFGSDTAPADTRTYSEFTLSSVVNDAVDAELAVSETGVLSFTSQCSVYSPCAGTLSSVNGLHRGTETFRALFHHHQRARPRLFRRGRRDQKQHPARLYRRRGGGPRDVLCGRHSSELPYGKRKHACVELKSRCGSTRSLP